MRALIVSEGKHEREGALEAIVSRLRGAHFQEIVYRRSNDRNVHAVHGKGEKLFKRAIRWLLIAQQDQFDVLVHVIDEDGRRERITQFNDAQKFRQEAFPRAFGVAVRSFDAWMLADETAVSTATGRTVQRQADPESLSDPKQVCAGLLILGSVQQSQSQMYAAIAESADLDTLVERCARGFMPFAERVRALPVSA